MSKTKKETNAEVAERRKPTKESGAEELCVDNIQTDLSESDDSSVSDLTKESL